MYNKLQFKPIYVWAQAKDNISEDDFFVITVEKTEQVEDLDVIQSKIYEFNKIAEQSEFKDRGRFFPLKNKILTKTHSFNDLEIKKSKDKVLLAFGTKDNDSVNRLSKINVFLDLEGIKKNQMPEYVKSFYEGFKIFCKITSRNPYDLNNITHPDFEEILTPNLQDKALEIIRKRPSSSKKKLNSHYILIFTIIVVAAFVIIKNK